MLDAEEKDEPCGKRQEVLHHGPNAEVEYLAQERQAQTRHTVEAVLAAWYVTTGVHDEEYSGNAFGHATANSCTGYA